MVELLALHGTDFHEASWKSEIIRGFIESKKGLEDEIDAFFFTGDAVECSSKSEDPNSLHNSIIQAFRESAKTEAFNSANERIGEIISQYGNDNDELDFEKLDPAVQGELFELEQRRAIAVDTSVGSVIENKYLDVKEDMQGIADLVPIYGILGNHDFLQGYDVLSDTIKFIELEKEVIIKGKSGKEFVLKGDLNTYEVPKLFGANPLLTQVLNNYAINYTSGKSTEEFEQPMSMAKFGGNENLIQELQEKIRPLLEYQTKERERLGSANDVDIYLSHKTANNVLGTGDIAKEYAANAAANMGGHHHKAYFGMKGIDDLLASANDAMEIIAGEETKVYNLSEEDLKHMNPGDKYFLVTAFDENKQVEYTDVYAYEDFMDAA